jgi:hypothetical protein
MTSFWLALSAAFKWSFGFYNLFGNVLNWVLFLVATGYFCYWCYVLVVSLGAQKDKGYFSPTEGKNPYYDPKIYKNEG